MSQLRDFLKRLWQQKLVRFFAVGCFNTVLDTSILLFFYKAVRLNELIANSISISIAISVSYFLNHRVVFRYPQQYSFKNYLRFFAITGFSTIIIQNIVIYIILHKLWVVPNARTVSLAGQLFKLKTLELVMAKIIAVLIGMAWNFLLYKYVVFRYTKQPDEAEEYIVA